MSFSAKRSTYSATQNRSRCATLSTETPNLAARLQAIAEPSTVVIAESTRRLLGSLFELEDLGPREFKGIAGPAVAFVYHCFDRIVTHGYLTGLSRPDQAAHFFRQVVGAPVTTKEILKVSSPVRPRDLAATT
jgi:hypothetical protein